MALKVEHSALYVFKAYGGMKTFANEEDARALFAFFDGPEYGLKEIFRDPKSGKWVVTQYFRTPFVFREQPAGGRFNDQLNPV